jgi:LmbE family N-acetylglucosaminyl deacetylase
VKRAVVVSPNLADAVLACGATLAGLAAGGWRLTLVTAFAGGADDRAAVLRDEDHAAASALGIAEVVHLPLAGGRTDERAPAHAAAALGPVLDGAQPDRVFAPGATAGHVDHVATVAALRWLDHPAPVVRFRDAPAAAGEPGPPPLPDERPIPVAALLPRKLDAAGAYATLAAERFGGVPELHAALTAYAEAEGRRLGADGPAEALVEPRRDTRKRRPGQDEDDKAALVRALRGGIGLTR